MIGYNGTPVPHRTGKTRRPSMQRPMPSNVSCPDCDSTSLTRRNFLRTTAGTVALAGAASAGLLGAMGHPHGALAAEAARPGATSETLVAQLYGSLSESQRKVLCFPFDHPLRSKVDNNWFIIDKKIGEALNKDQQDLVRQIFMGIHNPEYAQRVFDQVEHDGNGPGSFNEC